MPEIYDPATGGPNPEPSGTADDPVYIRHQYDDDDAIGSRCGAVATIGRGKAFASKTIKCHRRHDHSGRGDIRHWGIFAGQWFMWRNDQ